MRTCVCYVFVCVCMCVRERQLETKHFENEKDTDNVLKLSAPFPSRYIFCVDSESALHFKCFISNLISFMNVDS